MSEPLNTHRLNSLIDKLHILVNITFFGLAVIIMMCVTALLLRLP